MESTVKCERSPRANPTIRFPLPFEFCFAEAARKKTPSIPAPNIRLKHGHANNIFVVSHTQMLFWYWILNSFPTMNGDGHHPTN